LNSAASSAGSDCNTRSRSGISVHLGTSPAWTVKDRDAHPRQMIAGDGLPWAAGEAE